MAAPHYTYWAIVTYLPDSLTPGVFETNVLTQQSTVNNTAALGLQAHITAIPTLNGQVPPVIAAGMRILQ